MSVHGGRGVISDPMSFPGDRYHCTRSFPLGGVGISGPRDLPGEDGGGWVCPGGG